MDAKVYKLINDQIRKELYSAYLYLSFADYYQEEGLEGFAHWYEIQTQEERDHALIFRKYLHENGCKVKLQAIDQPDKTFSNHLEPLEAALEHEKYITGTINDIYTAALEAKDYRTMKFLDWFISEQQEEEDNAEKQVSRMRLFGNDAKALYDLDQENAARVYARSQPAGERIDSRRRQFCRVCGNLVRRWLMQMHADKGAPMWIGAPYCFPTSFTVPID